MWTDLKVYYYKLALFVKCTALTIQIFFLSLISFVKFVYVCLKFIFQFLFVVYGPDTPQNSSHLNGLNANTPKSSQRPKKTELYDLLNLSSNANDDEIRKVSTLTLTR